jgi:ABC-type glutathione transport system ATPase component
LSVISSHLHERPHARRPVCPEGGCLTTRPVDSANALSRPLASPSSAGTRCWNAGYPQVEPLPIEDDAAMNRYRFTEVSIVPQYAMSAMNPTRKVGALIRDLLHTRGVRYDSVLDELHRRLELVGLSESVLGMYPIELSGGMKQRAVIVLSTLLDPSLLIADEVTSALDVSTQKAVAQTLVEFRARGFVKSMMVITHDISVLAQIADSILIMYAGKLAEKAPTAELVDSPGIRTRGSSCRRCPRSAGAMRSTSSRASRATPRRS